MTNAKRLPNLTRQQVLIGLGAAALMIALVAVLSSAYPVGVDWLYTFHPAVQNWQAPYGKVEDFTNPPWLLLFLPHGALPLNIGNAINFTLNITVLMLAVRHYGGDWQTLILVFTSPFMLDLARTNNVDWVPLLATMLPPRWGLPLLMVKPQALGGIALIWLKRTGYRPRSVLMLVAPLTVVILLSFVIYGWWPGNVAGIPDDTTWNIAPFPFAIPVGLYLLYRAYRADDTALAAISTLFVTTYVAPYSLTGLFAIMGSRYKRDTAIAYLTAWIFFIYQTRRQMMGMI